MELNKKALKTVFLGVAGCIVLYWLLHETQQLKSILKAGFNVLSPFIVGSAMAFVLNVLVRGIENLLKKIEKPGLRRAIAIVLSQVIVFAVIFLVVNLLIPQLTKTVESIIAEMPGFIGRVRDTVMEFLERHPEVREWLTENTEFNNLDWSTLVQKVISLLGSGASTVMNGIFSAIGSLSTGIFNGIMSYVFAIYCLARKEILARQGRRLLYSFLPEGFCDETVRVLRLTNSTFANFISGQCLEALILGGMFAVFMTIFGFPYVPLVSVIISITALVPIVGAFVGCIVGALFILVDSPVQAFWFVGMFLLLQQIEGNMIYPRVVGTSIGLPGMWVLVAVAVGGDLMGAGGMLVMIPIASVAYALLREITNRRLAEKGIDRVKLQDHPPEIVSNFKENRKNRKEKRDQKNLKKKNRSEDNND